MVEVWLHMELPGVSWVDVELYIQIRRARIG
jgi:hypothetical protein